MPDESPSVANVQELSGISGYDAATDSANRSTLLFPSNSRIEYSRVTRRTLQTKNRGLEANFPFLTRIRGKIGRAVVGSGIFPRATTNDLEWNKRADDFFERWASNAALYSIDASRDLWVDQSLCAEELGAGDGEYFTLLVKHEGRFCTQSLDPFEIESPLAGGASGYEDGVRTDPFLRPIGYAVRELPAANGRQDARTFREVPAGDLLHIFRRRRARQLRGLPPIYSGLNDGHDALDLWAFEKATAKLHSVLAVSKVRKAENAGRATIAGQLTKALNADGTTSHLSEKMPRGAATVELAEGETLDLKTSTRPSVQVIEGMKFLCHFVALGADLPVSVLLSFAGVGGTAVRADLEDAQDNFDKLQDTVVYRHSVPIRTRRLAVAIVNGELPACGDPYWWRADWHGPKKITVDYGRAVAANIALVKGGMLSIPRYCEERGWDPRNEMRKQVDWLKEAQEYCTAQGVDFARFMEATPGAGVQLGDDEAPKKKPAAKKTEDDE